MDINTTIVFVVGGGSGLGVVGFVGKWVYNNWSAEARAKKDGKTKFRGWLKAWKARVDRSGKFHEISNEFEAQRVVFVQKAAEIENDISRWKRGRFKAAALVIENMTAGQVGEITTDTHGNHTLTGNKRLSDAIGVVIELSR